MIKLQYNLCYGKKLKILGGIIMISDSSAGSDLLNVLKLILDTMIKEKCTLLDALKKNSISKNNIVSYMNNHGTEECAEIWKTINVFNNDIVCSNAANRRIAGNIKGGSVKQEDLEDLYVNVVVPYLELSSDQQDAYREKRPLLDFDAIKICHEKTKSGEIYKKSVIEALNSLLKSGYKKTIMEGAKNRISAYPLLQQDEEISQLFEQVKSKYKQNKQEKSIISRPIDDLVRYIEKWNTNIIVSGKGDKLNADVLKIAELSDEEIKTKFPKIDIEQLRCAAKRIQTEGKTAKEQDNYQKSKFYGESVEITKRKKAIANGAYISNGITTQQQFDDFFKSIPNEFHTMKEHAKETWKKFNEYLNYDESTLQKIRGDLEKETEFIHTYIELLNIGIMVDYKKLKEIDVSMLGEIEEIAKKQLPEYYNRKNFRKANPLGNIIIDDEYKDQYKKEDKANRINRANKYKSQVDGEIDMIDSIMQLKKDEIAAEQEISNDAEVTEPDKTNSNKYDELSIEQLTRLQTELDTQIQQNEETISGLQASIQTTDEKIAEEIKKQEEQKRNELIQSIMQKQAIVTAGDIEIQNLSKVLASKQEELKKTKDMEKGE